MYSFQQMIQEQNENHDWLNFIIFEPGIFSIVISFCAYQDDRNFSYH
jgi:hypothetical protein